ncbi:MAG TPA: glycosyltransferase [Phycisphaerales bacterium]|nr:glycosyltransferase [Phycisphaerales bacterium]
MPKPLVSIIIPTYNRADIISNAVCSALQQTYSNKEIIVVDDGSTDNTCERLRVFGDNIRLVRQVNAGPSAARNAGVKASMGQILTFLDSDDLWLHSKIAKQVKMLQSVDESVPCCLCNALILRNSGKKVTSFDLAPIRARIEKGLWLNVTSILSTRCVLFTQAAAVRRSVFEKVGGFDESLRIMEDHDMALRLSLEGPWAFLREPLVIYHYGIEDGLAEEARHNDLQICKSIERIVANMLADRRVPETGAKKYFARSHTKMWRHIERSQGWSKARRISVLMDKSFEAVMQVCDFAFRHSPMYPKMEVTAFGGQNR